MPNVRKKHTAIFKAKVALEANVKKQVNFALPKTKELLMKNQKEEIYF